MSRGVQHYDIVRLQIQVPATPAPGAGSIKHRATELVADCADRDKRPAAASAATPVVLLPILIVGHSRYQALKLMDTVSALC